MRKLLILMVLCLASSAIFAQLSKKVNNSGIESSVVVDTTNILTKGRMNQTQWIIDNLDKYRKERLTAARIGFLGIGIGGMSFLFADKPSDQTFIAVTGGVFVLVSYFVNINAERLLSKKNLTLTGNGVALRF